MVQAWCWYGAWLLVAVRVLMFKEILHLDEALAVHLIALNEASIHQLDQLCIDVERVGRLDFHFDLLWPVG